jgi:hypothetical protein
MTGSNWSTGYGDRCWYDIGEEDPWEAVRANVGFLISPAISAILGLMPLVGFVIGSVLVAPINTIANTLLYYDLRVRKEEYSVEALASELHIEVDSGAT